MGEVNVLCEFTTMQVDLCVKKLVILHGEVPSELVSAKPADKDSDKDPLEQGDGTNAKRPHPTNPNAWHPCLKAKLAGPLKEAGFPMFTKILNFCGKDACHIFPRHSKTCAPNACLGRCFHGKKCQKDHTMAADDQVEPILTLLDPFIKDPTKLKSGQ